MSGLFRFLTAGESHGEALTEGHINAIVLAGAFLEKFGGDSLEEIRCNYDAYLASLKTW